MFIEITKIQWFLFWLFHIKYAYLFISMHIFLFFPQIAFFFVALIPYIITGDQHIRKYRMARKLNLEVI